MADRQILFKARKLHDRSSSRSNHNVRRGLSLGLCHAAFGRTLGQFFEAGMQHLNFPKLNSGSPLAQPIQIFSPAQEELWAACCPEFEAGGSKNREPLVSLDQHGIATSPFYALSDGQNFPYCTAVGTERQLRVRTSVYDALLQMNELLLSIGLEVLVLDGYRPLQTQEKIWRYFFEAASVSSPNSTHDAITKIAERYCANPAKFDRTNPLSWPAHMTGGSVDMTLRSLASKAPLFMGTMFDDPAIESRYDWYERRELSLQPRPISLTNFYIQSSRRILFNAAIMSGFRPYLAEWWHFDIGTQLASRYDYASGKSSKFVYGIPDLVAAHEDLASE